jgi:hypothetical protein
MTQRPTIHAISTTRGTETVCGHQLDPRVLSASHLASSVTCTECRPELAPALPSPHVVVALAVVALAVAPTAGPWVWVNVVLPAVLFVWSLPSALLGLL